MKNSIKIICSLLIIIVTFSSCAWFQPKPVDPEVYVTEGINHFKANEDSLAIVSWNKALEIIPDDAEVHNFVKLNKVQQAADAFRRAVELDSLYYEAANNLGYMLFLLKRYREAQDYFEQAIRIKSDYQPALKNLDLVLQVTTGSLDIKAFEYSEEAATKEDYSEQIPIYIRALEINPNYAKAHNNLAAALYYEGYFDSAYYHLEQAIRINSEYPEALNNFGYLNREAQNYDIAIKMFLKAITLKPKYIAALNNLGETFFIMKDYSNARKVFEATLSLEAENEKAKHFLEEIKSKEEETETKEGE